MKLSILTIFPDIFPPALSEGMIRAAREKGRLEVAVVMLRDFTDDTHRTTDDYPFGGGVGMVMKVEPIDRALAAAGAGAKGERPAGTRVVLLSPQGRRFTQRVAMDYAGLEHLVLVCGRYKGVDERVRELVVTEEISLGDFVLSGGEIAAAAVIEAVVRLKAEVLGNEESATTDSFAPGREGLLDCAWYTRPAEYRGLKVPEVLMSGHHAEIDKWRRQSSLERTRRHRPDLIDNKKSS